jgi:hypothetical protein
MGSSNRRQRCAFVGVRFLPAEKDALEYAAQTLGISLGELIRSSLKQTHDVDIDVAT